MRVRERPALYKGKPAIWGNGGLSGLKTGLEWRPVGQKGYFRPSCLVGIL